MLFRGRAVFCFGVIFVNNCCRFSLLTFYRSKIEMGGGGSLVEGEVFHHDCLLYPDGSGRDGKVKRNDHTVATLYF